MKYRIFSVLMILAMVASLCVVAAAPVSAQGDVTTVNATLGEDKAGKNTSCTIVLTGTWGVGDPITIEFPTAFDLSDLDMAVDDNDDYKNFKWNGAKIDSDALLVSGKKITIYAPIPCPRAELLHTPDMPPRCNCSIRLPPLACQMFLCWHPAGGRVAKTEPVHQ